ncbi:MAG: sigma-54 interaction domain-containing protein [Leptospirales bacterium]
MATAFIGESRRILRLLDMVDRVARTDSTLLITGESGTGKERIARMIHERSPRVRHPFIPVNCGAIPEGLIESELFGHEKGAFTGASNQRAGRFELAEGGTLFLDEIGELPLNLQVKLLRVLQEKVYERVGASQPRKANVRILAATHRNLERMVRDAAFREDLFYRISVIPIEIPSLRERIEDLPILIRFFVDRWVDESRGDPVVFSENAMEVLCRYPWPGNIRELENLVERFLVLKAGESVQPEDLPEKVISPQSPDGVLGSLPSRDPAEGQRDPLLLPPPPSLDGNGINLPKYLLDLEREMIEKSLARFGGNKTRASAFLGINRTTLIEKMKRFVELSERER